MGRQPFLTRLGSQRYPEGEVAPHSPSRYIVASRQPGCQEPLLNQKGGDRQEVSDLSWSSEWVVEATGLGAGERGPGLVGPGSVWGGGPRGIAATLGRTWTMPPLITCYLLRAPPKACMCYTGLGHIGVHKSQDSVWLREPLSWMCGDDGTWGLGPGQAPAISSPHSPACSESMLWFADTDVGSTETSKGSGAAQGQWHSGGDGRPSWSRPHARPGWAGKGHQGEGWDVDESYITET